MSRIEATGCYMPDRVVTNEKFSDSSILFEALEDFFCGYEERRHAGPEDTGISMAVKASEDALSHSQYSAEDIDMIVGMIMPNAYLYGDDLNLLQHEIGAMGASVLPINTACSTFLTALNIADSYIATGKKKRVLVVGASIWVHTMLNTEKPNYGFAGDGAAAIIVDADGCSLIDVHECNNSMPEVFDAMVMKSPVYTGQKEYFTITEPKSISTKKDLVLAPIEVAKKLLERNPDVEVDKIIMHQAGLKMMQLWSEKLGLHFNKVRHTLELFANMSVANIPVSLDYWVRNGDIKRGETILFFSPAAGGHYIAMLWRY